MEEGEEGEAGRVGREKRLLFLNKTRLFGYAVLCQQLYIHAGTFQQKKSCLGCTFKVLHSISYKEFIKATAEMNATDSIDNV